jgi:tripartite-type tricarboxylate transporter receptor subunit TctC
VIVASSHGTNKHIFKDLSWDPVKDFEPIVYTHVVPLLLTVHPSVPAKTVPELGRLDQGEPGQGDLRA